MSGSMDFEDAIGKLSIDIWDGVNAAWPRVQGMTARFLWFLRVQARDRHRGQHKERKRAAFLTYCKKRATERERERRERERERERREREREERERERERERLPILINKMGWAKCPGTLTRPHARERERERQNVKE